MKKSERKQKDSDSIVEDAFIAQQQLIALSRCKQSVDAQDDIFTQTYEDNTKQTSISLQSIVNTLLYPNRNGALDRSVLLNATAKSTSIRKLYQYVLEQVAICSSEALVAASSSETLSRRQAKDFSIQCNDDPQMPDQVHISVQLAPDTLRHHESAFATNSEDDKSHSLDKLIIHLGWQNAFYQLTFQHGFKQKQGMMFQTIVSKTSPEYSAIVDLESRIYLTFLGS